MSRVRNKARSPLKRLGTKKTSGVTKGLSPSELAVEQVRFEKELKRRLEKEVPSMRLDVRETKRKSESLISVQDGWRLSAAEAILAGDYAVAMDCLTKAIDMVPCLVQPLLADNYGVPLLSSKLRITEPFTMDALKAFKENLNLQLLATVITDRIYCKSFNTVSACLHIGFDLMLNHRDKALILFQHAFEIGPTAFSESVLECLQDILVRMESMNDDNFHFDCFLPLLRLATQWAYTCGKEHAVTAREGQPEIRPFNLALKLYAKHRAKHWDSRGRRDADDTILYFLRAEPRNGHYSTFHFTDTAGNFREDWYNPEVAHFLTELSKHVSRVDENGMVVSKLWEQDAQGRTPLYVLVEKLAVVPLWDFVQMGLLDHFVAHGACLCICDQMHKLRACYYLDQKLKDACRVPFLSLKCLAAKVCRRSFPQSVIDRKLPPRLALWCKLH